MKSWLLGLLIFVIRTARIEPLRARLNGFLRVYTPFWIASLGALIILICVFDQIVTA